MSLTEIVIFDIVFLPHTWPLLGVFVLVVGVGIGGLITCVISALVKPKAHSYAAYSLKSKLPLN